MTDSSSFTSLFALVDSHLSKCEVNRENDQVGSLPLPSLHGIQRGLSDTGLPGNPLRLPIPRFSVSESPITSVLSEQLSNMLKAKELKKQQELERQKLEEEMERMQLEEKSCVIDLMKAIQKPGQSQPYHKETLSSSSSFESLIIDQSDFIIGSPKSDNVKPPTPEPLLPCKTDMSYILKCKVKSGKCSPFGKVITSRLRPVAAPYLSRKPVITEVKRFDFNTQSPCDIIKEKLRKPSSYSHSEDQMLNILNFF